MARSFNYSILQFSPDHNRGEVVNIGLVVFLKDSLDVRLLKNLSKVRAINGKIDLDSLAELPELLNAFIAGTTDVDEQFGLISTLGNDLILSDMGLFSITHADQYDKHVDLLFKRLVTPPPTARRKPVQTKLITSVKSLLRNQHILGESADIDKHLVVPQYPIAENEGLYADFAIKNGVLNITETIDFRLPSKTKNQMLSEAALKAISLETATEEFGEDTKLYVVYAASTEQESKFTSHLNMLDKYSQFLLNIESDNDKAFFINRMLNASGRDDMVANNLF